MSSSFPPASNSFGKHYLGDSKQQGSIINLVVLNPFGNAYGYQTIQDESSREGIHLRTGCNCNPGACYDFLGITSDEVIDFSSKRQSCHDENDMYNGKPTGGIRISLGYLSTFEDAYAIYNFFKRYVDRIQ